MPEICRFYGIVIRMYFREHGRPHFHAEYGGRKASVRIEDLRVIEGRLTPRAERMVLEWAKQHRRELEQAWQRVERHQDPGKIAPLE
ncbi:MAG: DUF4160 domain-containing protein [Gemmatimonadetes bacterium]|nr:DUF4160 domain-containing protein [Gemmatimonadota bacterium]